MGFRVDAGIGISLAFATDLPPSVRAIHPSGILHARRAALLPADVDADADAGGGDGAESRRAREEHVFAWIENSLHIEGALAHLEALGFDIDPVFIPYSTQRNWIECYPHAVPGLECDEEGACAVRGDAGLAVGNIGGIVPKAGEKDEAGKGRENDGDENRDVAPAPSSASAARGAAKTKKRRRRVPRVNMLKDGGSILLDAERDELHVEIYGYLSWLHDALEELERRGAEAVELERSVASMIPAEDEGGEGEEERDEGAAAEGMEEAEGVEEEGGDGRKRAAIAGSRGGKAKKNGVVGVDKNGKVVGMDVVELKGVLKKLESAFAILPNVKLEREEEAAAAQEAKDAGEKTKDAQQDGDKQLNECDKEGGDDPTQQQQEEQQKEQQQNDLPPLPPKKGPPFLEGALSESLARLVLAREDAGKKRRSRRRRQPPRRDSSGGNTTIGYRGCSTGPVDFDVLFSRLERYREVHGNCLVPKKYAEDRQLACFVKDIRYNMTKLKQRGLEHDEIPDRVRFPSRISGKILTAERIARLDSIGFCWNAWEECFSKVPKVSWQGRFEEAVGYREEHGRWPSQSMGTLGQWVQRQRRMYAKRDKNFMRDKVAQLDEVGFEWTPRGNTKISWDEGFERLIEFGRINGHYEVPLPIPTAELAEKKFHRWVESLHSMYRSYQLGRQHGSLTEERITLLTEHGFQFRTTLSEEVE